jgi:phage tail sheath protein FI
MLCTVERLIEYVLQRYIFDNNTPRTRFQIFEDVDALLFPLKDEGAFTDYSIKIDSSNNNGSVLDGSYGIIEIEIFPTSAIRSFICELNVKKGSGIEVSGFNI